MKGESGTSEGVVAILLGAGQGSRMGGLDKAFLRLRGRPLIFYPLRALQDSPSIHGIVLVLREGSLRRGQRLAEGFSKVLAVCPGGERRQDSVREGMKRVGKAGWVLVHDGVRPFLTQELIEQGLETAHRTGAAVAVVPVVDTIKVVREDCLVDFTPERKLIYAAQTPQVFRYNILARACELSNTDATDDASLVERLGIPVTISPGSPENIKVTTFLDLALARLLARQKGL